MYRPNPKKKELLGPLRKVIRVVGSRLEICRGDMTKPDRLLLDCGHITIGDCIHERVHCPHCGRIEENQRET